LNAEQLKILELASMQQQQRRIITHCPTLLSLHSGHQKKKKKKEKKIFKVFA
jgi:pantothenate synthetase